MRHRVDEFVIAGVFLFAFAFLSFTPRSEFELLLIALAFAFGAWSGLLNRSPRPAFLWVLALLARLVFFRYLPLLSDDFYRFLWDGSLLLNGINPMGKVPAETASNHQMAELLLAEMNSPNYPSVYPPIHQLGMAFGATFEKLLSGVNGMRSFIMTCEGVGLLYFYHFSRDRLLPYLMYLLNPLVIIEGSGNVHFEAAVLPFLAIGLDRADRFRPIGAGLGLGAAVLTKLNPLILLPAFYRRFSTNQRIAFALSFLVLCLFAFLPFLRGFFDAIPGYSLYFRQFEFNASIYYLISELGKSVVDYNPIAVLGPSMGVLATASILLIAVRPIPLIEKALLSYLALLLFSTTVHPWYLIPFVFLAIRAKRRVLLIWSLTVFFSYSHYVGEWLPKYPWIFAEYLTLFIALIYSYRSRPIPLFRG